MSMAWCIPVVETGTSTIKAVVSISSSVQQNLEQMSVAVWANQVLSLNTQGHGPITLSTVVGLVLFDRSVNLQHYNYVCSMTMNEFLSPG